MERVNVTILEPKAKRLLDDLESLKLIRIERPASSRDRRRRFGSMKGFVTYVADDFDEPVEDFKEYM